LDPKRRSGRAAALIVPAAAVVAGLLLYLRTRIEPPTIPAYTLASLSDAAIPELVPGGQFALDLVPTQQLTGAIAARGFLMRGDSVWLWDAPQFMVDRDGTLHLRGPVDVLFRGFPSGDWDVAIAVGRPDSLPTEPRYVLGARDRDAGARSWMLLHERVHLGS
jgi:hypothetical protein